MSPKTTLKCGVCGKTARRELGNEPGSRGFMETCSKLALCPSGHGIMTRMDGNENPCAKGMNERRKKNG